MSHAHHSPSNIGESPNAVSCIGSHTQSPRRLLVLLFVIVLVVSGCAPRPPGTVALSFYMRDRSEVPHHFMIDGVDPPIDGPVQNEPASTGCGWVDPSWTLRVWTGPEGDAAGAPAARLTGAEVGPLDPVAVWVDVDPAGGVHTGVGVPAWWNSDVQRCPGS